MDEIVAAVPQGTLIVAISKAGKVYALSAKNKKFQAVELGQIPLELGQPTTRA